MAPKEKAMLTVSDSDGQLPHQLPGDELAQEDWDNATVPRELESFLKDA